jgi:hypothetical protein
VLVSSDGYVLDGHHQWLSRMQAGAPIKAIVFNAPIADLLPLAKEFPSAKAAPALAAPAAADATATPASAPAAVPAVPGGQDRPAAVDAVGQPAAAVAAAPKPLSVGRTPQTATPVTVRDGVVHIGEDPALNYDTAEPIKVPAGASDAQIRQALKDGGALSSKQRFYGGNQQAAPAPAPAAAAAPFDSEQFDRDREDRIKASREAGFTHLDKVPAYVETMRGKPIEYVHDPKVRGVIRTVANNGEVVVNWADDYSAEKELATKRMDGKKEVWQTWLMPSDLKDYRLQKDAAPAKPTETPLQKKVKAAQDAKPVTQQAQQSQPTGKPEPTKHGKDGKPLSEGGKPFPTELAADRFRRENLKQGRVVKVAGGFAVRDVTDAELKARTANGNRLQASLRKKSAEENPLLAWLAGKGMFHREGAKNSLKSQFSPDADPSVRGYGKIFREDGMQIDKLAESAVEDGFLPRGDEDTAKLSRMIEQALAGKRVAPLYAEDAGELEAERARAAAEEQAAEDAVGELPDAAFAELEQNDDDIPWGAVASNATIEDAMRALTFTDEEIQDAIAHQAAQVAAGPQADGAGDRGSVEAAAGEAQGAAGEGAQRARDDAEGLRPDDFLPIGFGDFVNSHADTLMGMPEGSWVLTQGNDKSYRDPEFTAFYSLGNGRWGSGEGPHKTAAEAMASLKRRFTGDPATLRQVPASEFKPTRQQDLLGDTPNESQQAAARLRAERDEKAQRQQQAAPDDSGFTLTGSKRATDEAAARGQGDLLGDKKPGDGPQFSRSKQQPAFYSALTREVEALPDKALPSVGWKAALAAMQNKGRVKSDEIEWSGVREWLDTQSGKVPRAAVLDFLRANGVQVQEVTKGAAPSMKQVRERYMQAMVRQGASPSEADQMFREMRLFAEDDTHDEKLKDRGFELVMKDGENTGNEIHDAGTPDGTKYASYTLPGGQNYREVLLTLPERQGERYTRANVEALPANDERVTDPDRFWYFKTPDNVFQIPKSKYAEQVDARDYILREKQPAAPAEANYRSSHWDEANVVAHIRLNDRTDADGKRVLFVEELQSDWAQEGRRQGFKADYAVVEEGGKFLVRNTATGEYESSEFGPMRFDQRRFAEQQQRSAQQRGGIPRAPFVGKTDAWLSLALKRIVKMAADEGYDRVAFVNGEQSAERYDLSKRIAKVTYEPQTGFLRAWEHDAPHPSIAEKTTPEKLADLIGKDAAQRLLAAPLTESNDGQGKKTVHRLSGLELKLGGEGMKAFYDKIVPAAANKLLAKLGGGKVAASSVSGETTTGTAAYEVRYDTATGWQVVKRDTGRVVRNATSREDAFAKLQKLGTKTAFTSQLAFDITPGMRETAAGGLPQFRRGTETAPRGMQANNITRAVQQLTRDWLRKPAIHVVEGMDDPAVPELVREVWQRQNSQGASGEPEGFHYRGEVYLLAPHMASMDDIRRVLFHEALGHFGLRGIFGERLNPILAQIATMRPQLVAKKAQQYGLNLGIESERLLAAEEVLAEMAQTRPEIGWVRRAIAAIRTWLREHGIIKGLSDDEILTNYLLPARGFVERGASTAPTSMSATPAFHRAFHGTPHAVDRFSTDKIGTGEGNQSYGWGLYFAESKDVADHYRKTLSGDGYGIVKIAGRDQHSDHEFGNMMVLEVDERPTTTLTGAEGYRFMRDQLRPWAQNNRYAPGQQAKLALDWLDEAEAAGKSIEVPGRDKTGALYEVNIPDEVVGKMLLWDKPLSEQPENVKKALREWARDEGETKVTLALRGLTAADKAFTGESLYRMFAEDIFKGPKIASEELNGMGIPGIKYLDGNSRNRPLKDIKREFLAQLPENADFDEVMELAKDGTFSAKNAAIVNALAANDWLGFDYPAQAISAALGRDLANYDPSPELTQAVADAQVDATHNLVVFNDANVKITHENGEPLNKADREQALVAFSVRDTGGMDRKRAQARAKELGLPATGTTADIADLVRIATSDPRGWSRADFDRIATHLSVHQDLRDGSATRRDAIMRDGLANGMVDNLSNLATGKYWTWAQRLKGGDAYVFITGALKTIGPGNPRLVPGTLPLFRFESKPGQDVFEAIRDTAVPNEPSAPAGSGDVMFSRAAVHENTFGTLTPEQEQALKNVGGIQPKQTIADRFAALRANLGLKVVQGLFDQFAPIKSIGQHEYMLARMSKAAEGTMEAALLYGKPFLRDGVADVDVADGGFAKVLASLKGEHDRFLWWVAAQRADRLKAEGRENLFTDADISHLKTLDAGTFADGAPRAAAYAAALTQLTAYNEAALKLAMESGLIDQDAFDAMRHDAYVPFYRLLEDGDELPKFRGGSGLVNQQAFKKLKGGTDKLNNDLLQNLLLNWSHLYAAAAKNRAAQATLQQAVNMAIAYPAPQGGKGTVKVKEGGRDVAYRVEDPYLLEAIASLNYVPSPLIKPLAAFKNLLTLGVTANPAFKIRNIIRDSIAAVAQADLSYNPFENVAKGWKATSRDSQTFASMLAAGGVMRFGSQEDTSRVRRQIDALGGEVLDENGWRKLTGQMSELWHAYQEFGDRGENVNRAALYEKLIAQGKTHAEAAFMARDLMDFSMGGQWGAVRFLAQTVPFLNARLVGLQRLGQAAKEDPKRFMAVTGAVMLASLALMAGYSDDDDWKRREDWDRDAYWWFKIGGTAFRIPKPFEIGALGTLAERTAELMFSKEMTGKRFNERLSAMLFQTFNFDPTPQAFKPILDVYANKDSFTGRPIEGMSDERLRPQDRAGTHTSEVARFLGKLGMPDPAQLAKGQYSPLSPKQVDFLLRGYFGWFGTVAQTVSDYGLRPLADRGEKPAMQMRDVFLAGNFVEALPSGASRYVTTMYEQAKEVEQAYASYHAAIKAGDPEKALQILEADGPKIRSFQQVVRIKRAESQITAQIRRIEDSRDLSAADKRDQIAVLERRKEQIARPLTGGPTSAQ